MSQISPPIRILLVAVVGLLAAWMLFLRPSSETAAPPAAAPATTAPASPVTNMGKAAEKAREAAAAQEARDGNVQQAIEGETGAATAPSTTSKPGPGQSAAGSPTKAETRGLPAPVRKAVATDKVLVLLFWNPKSADDRAVKRAVAKVDRWDGQVFVRTANLNSISKYGRITRGADVEQSPTVVVVDRDLNAEPLVGFVDTVSIDQAIVDAMRNSGGLIKHAYLSEVNQICATTGSLSRSIVVPNSTSEAPAFLADHRRVARRTSTRFKAVKAPARWRGFKRATAADHAAYVALIGEWAAYVGSKPSPARVASSVKTFAPREHRLAARYNRRMDAQHVISCGTNA